MRSQKGSRTIVADGVEYRWRARGQDGFISVGIWPASNVGPYIQGHFGYHAGYIAEGEGIWSSAGNQIVITNRIIRRIIGHAKVSFGYDPRVPGKDLNLRGLDDVVEWGDAVRAMPDAEPEAV